MIELKPNEQLQTVLRRHWFVVGLEIAAGIVLLLFGLAAYLYAERAEGFLPEFLARRIHMQTVLPLLLLIYVMALWSFIFTALTDYYLDVWVVTDKRVVDIEQHGLFNREVSEFGLEKIQDVTVRVHGIIATFFDYGNIYIQTASEGTSFVFKQVPKPYEVKNLILSLSHLAPQEDVGQKKNGV